MPQALTALQLSAMEQNPTYREILRSNILKEATAAKASTGAGLDAAGAADWFRKRHLAESILFTPQASIEPSYWAARSLVTLRGMSLDITDDSTTEQILEVITPGNHEYIAGLTYAEESKKVTF